MKFLPKEYEAFQAAISASGKNPKNFSQLKKRGHIYILEAGREMPFCFMRKEETLLNDELKWEKKTTYFLDAKNKISVGSWEEVMDSFKRWLKEK